MIRLLIAAAACVPLLSGCVIYADDGADSDVIVRANQGVPAEDAVFSAWISDGLLHARVPSGGCTEAEDFEVLVTDADDGARNIYLRRVGPDECDEHVGLGVELTWPLESIGVTKDRENRLTNPILL